MRERTVAQSIPKRPLAAVSPQASAHDAACIMSRTRCGSVLVLDASDSLVGIFTERDLMTKVVAKALDPARVRMVDVMTPNPQSVPPGTSVADAVLLMRDCGFRHLPVVSAATGVVGVFSMRDAMPREIVEADQFAEHLEQEFCNVLG